MFRLALFICFSFWLTCSYGQTGIGTTAPDVSAKLEISSTNKGLLIPRMTDAQKTAIPTPANGLMVYQTDGLAGFYVNTGSSASPTWTRVNSNWTRTGNDIAYTSGNISTTGTITGGNSSTSSISGFAANVTSISANYSITAADNEIGRAHV